MTDTTQPHDDAIDRLVGQHLERRFEGVDTSGLLARIQADRTTHDSAPSVEVARGKRGWSRSFAWPVVTAIAAMVLLFVGGRILVPDSANAAITLRGVQSEHARPVDHCYRVQFAPDPRFWDKGNPLSGPSTSVLWTRGDRFWSACTIGGLHLNIGREASGGLWISPSREKGIRFANDSSALPEKLDVLCAVNSMSVPRLVEEVLADFELHSDPSSQRAAKGKSLVWARLKADRTHPLISDALLEIDPETNVLNRLVLWITKDGQPGGTVTYTLLESGQLDDERYRLETYLNDDAEIEVHTLPPPEDAADFGDSSDPLKTH